MPVAPHAAVIPGKFYHTGKALPSLTFNYKHLNTSLSSRCDHKAYTEAINLLNYSAVVIPVTKANKHLDLVDESYQPLNAIDQKNWDACRLHLCTTNFVPGDFMANMSV